MRSYSNPRTALPDMDGTPAEDALERAIPAARASRASARAVEHGLEAGHRVRSGR